MATLMCEVFVPAPTELVDELEIAEDSPRPRPA
jgi:hypothetical protein